MMFTGMGLATGVASVCFVHCHSCAPIVPVFFGTEMFTFLYILGKCFSTCMCILHVWEKDTSGTFRLFDRAYVWRDWTESFIFL